MLNPHIPVNSLMSEWLHEPDFERDAEADFQNELSGWYDKLKSLLQRNKGKAQKLAAVAQIVGRLVGTPVPDDSATTKPPVTHTNYADLQKVEDRRRRDQIQTTVKGKTTAGGIKELENTLLGEILDETGFETSPEYEAVSLIQELAGIYSKLRESAGKESILAEIFLDATQQELEEEIRTEARIKHFKGLSNPAGVEVHHWYPIRYMKPLNINSNDIKTYTVALDRTSHAFIGKAIDLYMQKAGKKADLAYLERLLNVLGDKVNGQGIRLKKQLFVRLDRDHVPMPDATSGDLMSNLPRHFYRLRSIRQFRDLMQEKFGISKHQLEIGKIN